MDKKSKINMDKAIDNVIKKFQNKRSFFITEHDVQAYLYSELIKLFKTNEDDETTAIHCELSPINTKGSKIKSDISICEVKSLIANPINGDVEIDTIHDIELKYCIFDEKNEVLAKLYNKNYTKNSKKNKGDYRKNLEAGETNVTILIFSHKNEITENDLIKIQKHGKGEDNIRIIFASLKKTICVKNGKKCSLTI
jgi:uncharacterized membrane protein